MPLPGFRRSMPEQSWLTEKVPSSVIDYAHDWTNWLLGDTILTSNWSVSPAGITIADSSINGGSIAVVWLSSGSVGTTYRVTNTITTAGGRTESRSFDVEVVSYISG